MKRVLAHLCCLLLLFVTVNLPAAQASDPAPTPAPLFVDYTLDDADMAFLQDGPVVDEPGEPPGIGIPGDSSTLVAILAAAAGGFVVGLFVGVIGCCMLYYFSLY